MIYYLIQAYHKEIDVQYDRHLHPCYLTCFEMDSEKLMLQSGQYDALKFTNENTARTWLTMAEEQFPSREFEIVPFDSRIFGRVQPKYVVEI
jgi:hypothetical protein